MQGALPPCMPPYPISGLPGHCAPGTIRSSCGGRQSSTPGLTKLARHDRHSANPLRLHQNPDDSCVSPMTFQRRNCSTTADTRTLLPPGKAISGLTLLLATPGLAKPGSYQGKLGQGFATRARPNNRQPRAD